MKNNHSPEFCVIPYSELKLSKKAPLIAFALEKKDDRFVRTAFPEIEHTRLAIERRKNRDGDALRFFHLKRDDALYPGGLVYLGQNLKNRPALDPSDIPFYRDVLVKTAKLVDELRAEHYKGATILLPSTFFPKNISEKGQLGKHLYSFVQTIVESIVVGNSTLDDFLTESEPRLEHITFVHYGTADLETKNFFENVFIDGERVGRAVSYARRFTQLPFNEKVPVVAAEKALGTRIPKKTERLRGLEKSEWSKINTHIFPHTVTASCLYGEDALRKHGKYGFGCIADVGKGSPHEPCLLKVRYMPEVEGGQTFPKKVVICGKGVVFDSGGVNAKVEEEALHHMNYDMAGAATALAALMLAAESDLYADITVLVPFVHNAMDGMQPHDITRAYNGTTIEVINTDAEGRLILCDVQSYAEWFLRPDHTISIGTLSDISDIGPDFLQVLATSELRGKARYAALASYEKIVEWPCAGYFDSVSEALSTGSDTADMVNSIDFAAGSAGPIFLASFLRYTNSSWLFMNPDSVFAKDADDYGAGPGFGVRFLWELIKQLA